MFLRRLIWCFWVYALCVGIASCTAARWPTEIEVPLFVALVVATLISFLKLKGSWQGDRTAGKITYQLGPQLLARGFEATKDTEIPGRFGTTDAVAAHWERPSRTPFHNRPLRVAVDLGFDIGLQSMGIGAGDVLIFTQTSSVKPQPSTRPVRLGNSGEEWPHASSVAEDAAGFVNLTRLGQGSYPTVLSFVATEDIREKVTELSTFCEQLPQRAIWDWDGEWLRLDIAEWSDRWRPDLKPSDLERALELVEELGAVLGTGPKTPTERLLQSAKTDSSQSFRDLARDLLVLYEGESEYAEPFLVPALNSSIPLVRVRAQLELGEESTESKDFLADLGAAIQTRRDLKNSASVAEEQADQIVAKALELVWPELEFEASNDVILQFLSHGGQPGFKKALDLLEESLPELGKEQRARLLQRLFVDGTPNSDSEGSSDAYPEVVYRVGLATLYSEPDLVPITAVLALARRDGWSKTFHSTLAQALTILGNFDSAAVGDIEDWLLWRLATPVSRAVDIACIQALSKLGGVRSVEQLTTYCDQLFDENSRKQAARAALGQIRLRLEGVGADAGQLTFLPPEDDSEERGALSEAEAEGAVSLED